MRMLVLSMDILVMMEKREQDNINSIEKGDRKSVIPSSAVCLFRHSYSLTSNLSRYLPQQQLVLEPSPG